MSLENEVRLTGRLTKDPEVKVVKGDLKVAKFSIAQNKWVKDKDDVALFFDLTAFRSQAEFLEKYAKKGNLIGIVGHIESNLVEQEDGSKRKFMDLIVDEVKNYTPRDSNSSPTEDKPKSKFREAQETGTKESAKQPPIKKLKLSVDTEEDELPEGDE